MNTSRREFLLKGTMILASGSFVGLLQSCSKDGNSPLKSYEICQNTCVGCGDCFDVCMDDAIILPTKSFYQIDAQECISCGKCVNACEYGAIKVAYKRYVLDSEKCVGCGECIDVCMYEGNAISWERDYYQVRGKCKPGTCGNPCITACEEDAISIDNNKAVIDISKCIRCGQCVSVCPVDAINPAHMVMDESLCTHCGKCYDVCDFDNVITIEEPEGYFEPHIDANICKVCGNCRNSCTDYNAIFWEFYKAKIDITQCSGCGDCVDVCLYNAVSGVINT
jgi:ferredoxin